MADFLVSVGTGGLGVLRRASAPAAPTLAALPWALSAPSSSSSSSSSSALPAAAPHFLGATRTAAAHQELVAHGEVDRLGMAFVSMPPSPVVIKELLPGSWAELAGVEVGDAVVEIDGATVACLTADAFKDLLKKRPLRLRLCKSGSRTPAEEPASSSAAAGRPPTPAPSTAVAAAAAGAASPRPEPAPAVATPEELAPSAAAAALPPAPAPPLAVAAAAGGDASPRPSPAAAPDPAPRASAPEAAAAAAEAGAARAPLSLAAAAEALAAALEARAAKDRVHDEEQGEEPVPGTAPAPATASAPVAAHAGAPGPDVVAELAAAAAGQAQELAPAPASEAGAEAAAPLSAPWLGAVAAERDATTGSQEPVTSAAPAPAAVPAAAAPRSAVAGQGSGSPTVPAAPRRRVRFEKEEEAEKEGEAEVDLVCPICEEVMYRPVRTQCGHCFCMACLSSWLTEGSSRSCPLCRAALSGGGSSPSSSSSRRGSGGGAGLGLSRRAGELAEDSCAGQEDATPAFAADPELERRAVALLGAEAYYERELDAMGPKMTRKLKARLRTLRRLSDGSDVAIAGVGLGALTGAATAWGASAAAYMSTFVSAQAVIASGGFSLFVGAHSVASVAFWTTALSAEVAGDALLAGAVAGVGTSAFFAGMKLAAWLDGQYRYCILQSTVACPVPEHAKSSISMLNLLDDVITVRVFAGRRIRCEKTQRGGIDAVVDYVAVSSGLRAEDSQERTTWRLEPQGDPVAECAVLGKRESRLELPPKRGQMRLLLSVTLNGTLYNRDVGMCRARHGQRFIVGELDGSSNSLLRRKTDSQAAERAAAQSSSAPSPDPPAGDESGGEEADADAAQAEDGANNEEPGSSNGFADLVAQLFGLEGRSSSRHGACSIEDAEAPAAEEDAEEPAPAPHFLGTDSAVATRDPDDSRGSILDLALAHLWGVEDGDFVASDRVDDVPDDSSGEEEAEVPQPVWQRRRWEDERLLQRGSPPASASSSSSRSGAGSPYARPPPPAPAPASASCAAAAAAAGEPAGPTGPAALWICRHGEKEAKGSRPRNWDLLVTKAGLAAVEAVAWRVMAKLLAAGKAPPRRIVSSPFPRCILTAGVYARVFSLPAVCVEPGLCEVLTPTMGAEGFDSEPPSWREDELLELLSSTGPAGIRLDSEYVPVVPREALRAVEGKDDRSEVDERVQALASRVAAGQFDGALLVTHGSPAYRLVRVLTDDGDFEEPFMGSVVELAAQSDGAGGPWGRIASFELPPAVA